MKIKLPDEVNKAIKTLESSGYEAYAVGGGVRDSLMGLAPNDWDVCTSALPEQAMKCFEGMRIIETGVKHGTITVIINHRHIEVTTYRTDGVYSDNRRPDTVEFVRDLKEDLSRRDFTVNALAYHPERGLADYFGGEEDIKNKIIRCVGDADRRFGEDALRIMRALRLASIFNFDIAPETSEAIFRNKGLLQNISEERVAAELNRLITGEGAGPVLLCYANVISEVLPEILPMTGYGMNGYDPGLYGHGPGARTDIWVHTALSVACAPADKAVRLAMLFHDSAVPLCNTPRSPDARFHDHPAMGAELAKAALSRLKYDNETIGAVSQLVLCHESHIGADRVSVKRWLNKIGEKRLRQLIEAIKADAAALPDEPGKVKYEAAANVIPVIGDIIGQRECFHMKDLAVNGFDIMEAGARGKKIGEILDRLLDMVISEQVANDKAELLKIAYIVGRGDPDAPF